MKIFNFEKYIHIIMKIAALKNYIFPNLMSISGYLYFIYLYLYRFESSRIYIQPGADETVEAYSHTFEGFAVLVIFIIISLVFFILSIVEYLIRKKCSSNVILKNKLPKSIEIIHSILFWIGILVPLSSLVIAILFVVFAPISDFILRLS